MLQITWICNIISGIQKWGKWEERKEHCNYGGDGGRESKAKKAVS